MGTIITFAQTKGGTGKSTLAVNSAYRLSHYGYRTVLVDTDKQGTAKTWLSSVPGHEIAVDSADDAEEVREKLSLQADCDFMVVDTPGSAGPVTHQAILLADFVIVPLAPSALDIWPLENVLSLVRIARFRRNGLPNAALVLNKTSERDRAGRELRQLSEKFGVPFASKTIRGVQGMRQAPESGKVIYTMAGNKAAKNAAKDLDAVLDEVLETVLPKQRRASNG